VHSDRARLLKTLRQRLDTADRPLIERRGHQSGWPPAVGMEMVGSTNMGSAMMGSAMVGTGTVASTAVGPTTVGPHRQVRPLCHCATNPSRNYIPPVWTVCQMTILLSSQIWPIPSMSRRVINCAKLCLSHPFSRIKWIRQWAVDRDPVLTSTTSARIGKTAISRSIDGSLGNSLSTNAALRGPGPRPVAVQEVDGAPGDVDDVSCPGSDRWRRPCWLGS